MSYFEVICHIGALRDPPPQKKKTVPLVPKHGLLDVDVASLLSAILLVSLTCCWLVTLLPFFSISRTSFYALGDKLSNHPQVPSGGGSSRVAKVEVFCVLMPVGVNVFSLPCLALPCLASTCLEHALCELTPGKVKAVRSFTAGVKKKRKALLSVRAMFGQRNMFTSCPKRFVRLRSWTRHWLLCLPRRGDCSVGVDRCILKTFIGHSARLPWHPGINLGTLASTIAPQPQINVSIRFPNLGTQMSISLPQSHWLSRCFRKIENQSNARRLQLINFFTF